MPISLKCIIPSYVNESVDLYVKKEGRNDYVALIAVTSGIGETLVINASDLDADAAEIDELVHLPTLLEVLKGKKTKDEKIKAKDLQEMRAIESKIKNTKDVEKL